MTIQQQEQVQESGDDKSAVLSAAEKKKAWDDLTKMDARREELRHKLETVNLAYSDKVQEIKETQGDGPFQVSGLGLVQIRSRKTKGEDGQVLGTTYYLARMSSNVQVIE